MSTDAQQFDVLELAFTTEGIHLVMAEPDTPEGVISQRTFILDPGILSVEQQERVLEILEEVAGWVEGVVTPAEEHEPDTPNYDNPEEVERWGRDDT